MALNRYYTLRSIREHYEKETAWLGICAMISHNPQAVVPVRATAHTECRCRCVRC